MTDAMRWCRTHHAQIIVLPDDGGWTCRSIGWLSPDGECVPVDLTDLIAGIVEEWWDETVRWSGPVLFGHCARMIVKALGGDDE